MANKQLQILSDILRQAGEGQPRLSIEGLPGNDSIDMVEQSDGTWSVFHRQGKMAFGVTPPEVFTLLFSLFGRIWNKQVTQ